MRSGAFARGPRPSLAVRILLVLGTALIATPLSQFAPQVVHADALTPTVSAISPEAGPTTGGTTVTISGTNFVSGVTTVSFGSVAASSVNVTSSTQLTAVTPVEGEGQVQVTATNVAVTSTPAAPATTFQFTNPGPFHPLVTRICNTNLDGNTTACAGHTLTPAGPSSALNVQVTGVGGIPSSGVAAVVMDLFTAPTSAGSYGNVGVYPTGLAGGASGLSWVNGNYGTLLVEIPVGAGGQVTVTESSASTSNLNLILDVQGYVADTQTDASGLINTLTPAVICDTATASGTQCAVPNNAGWGGGSTHTFQVTGHGGVPPTGVSAVVLNVQTYAENNVGWLVAYPAGQASPPPTASMLWNAWTPVTNHIIVPVDSTGQIKVYNGEGAGTGTQVQFVVDGWFTDSSNSSATGGLYYPNNGTLVCDTMAGTGTPCSAGAKLTAGAPMPVQIAGLGGVPSPGSSLTGVELSLTVTNVTGLASGQGTNVCLYPSDGSCQEADLNLYGGVPANLLVIVPIGADGKVDVLTAAGSMDVLVSVVGYYDGSFTVAADVASVSGATGSGTVAGQDFVCLYRGNISAPNPSAQVYAWARTQCQMPVQYLETDMTVSDITDPEHVVTYPTNQAICPQPSTYSGPCTDVMTYRYLTQETGHKYHWDDKTTTILPGGEEFAGVPDGCVNTTPNVQTCEYERDWVSNFT